MSCVNEMDGEWGGGGETDDDDLTWIPANTTT